jgi:hypothetical protein
MHSRQCISMSVAGVPVAYIWVSCSVDVDVDK